MKLKENILFRLEHFGGIIIDKKTFDRKELTFDEALFIRACQFLREEQAKQVVCKVLEKDSLELSDLSLKNFLEESNDTKDCCQVYHQLKKEYEEIKKKEFLSFPLELTIYPSMRCNLNCKFCFVENKTDKKMHSAEEWAELVKYGKEHGLLSVSILGGEPSLYYDIDNLLLKCEELKINTVITTNALHIKPTTKEILFHSKYITPAVSIQSLDNLNFLLMGCDSKKQLEFVEECLNHNKEVRINSVYTFQTTEQIQKIYDYCVQHGISRYSVSNYSNTKTNSDMKYAHDLKDLAELDETIKRNNRQKYGDKTSPPIFSAEGCMLYSCYAEGIKEKIEFSPFEKQYFGCRARYTNMEIYSDGSVYPCCRYETVTSSTSNAFEDGKTLCDIWESDKNYQKLRGQETQNKICLKCAFVDICQGGCYPARMKENPQEADNIRTENCQFCKGLNER